MPRADYLDNDALEIAAELGVAPETIAQLQVKQLLGKHSFTAEERALFDALGRARSWRTVRDQYLPVFQHLDPFSPEELEHLRGACLKVEAEQTEAEAAATNKFKALRKRFMNSDEGKAHEKAVADEIFRDIPQIRSEDLDATLKGFDVIFHYRSFMLPQAAWSDVAEAARRLKDDILYDQFPIRFWRIDMAGDLGFYKRFKAVSGGSLYLFRFEYLHSILIDAPCSADDIVEWVRRSAPLYPSKLYSPV
jgi:hypothetical protein